MKTDKYYKAVCIEKTAKEFGQILGQTKTGNKKGLSKEDFAEAMNNSTVYSFEIIEF